MKPDKLTEIPVTISAADIREITWIIGQFVRIAEKRPDVLVQMTGDDPDFAVGMCHLAQRFSEEDKATKVNDELDAVALDDIMIPLVAWSNALQMVAMHAADRPETTDEDRERQRERCRNVRVVDQSELGDILG